jgi:hypothetical protein
LRAGRYDITIEQGSALSLPVTYQAGGTAVDLTGYQARLQDRKAHSSAVKLIELTTENAGIVVDADPTTGRFTVSMAASATAALNFARAVYDLELVPPANEPFRLLNTSQLDTDTALAASSDTRIAPQRQPRVMSMLTLLPPRLMPHQP